MQICFTEQSNQFYNDYINQNICNADSTDLLSDFSFGSAFETSNADFFEWNIN